jgi:hypothetical protein
VHDLLQLAARFLLAQLNQPKATAKNLNTLVLLDCRVPLPRRRHVASLHIILDHLRNSLALLGTVYTLTSCTVNL